MSLPELLKRLADREQKREADGARDKALWLEFGRAIRVERKSRKIKRGTFAHSLQCSTAMITYLESGKRGWTFAMARKAVKLLAG